MDEYNFKVTVQEVHVIADALNNIAYRVAAPLLAKLQAQITEQDTDQRAKATST